MTWEKTRLGDYLHYVPPGRNTALCGVEPDETRRIPTDGYCSTCLTICWTIRYGEHDRLAPADLDVDGWPTADVLVDAVDYERREL